MKIWQGEHFRRIATEKIYEMLKITGQDRNRSARAMENYISNESRSLDEYFDMVAQLITYLKDVAEMQALQQPPLYVQMTQMQQLNFLCHKMQSTGGETQHSIALNMQHMTQLEMALSQKFVRMIQEVYGLVKQEMPGGMLPYVGKLGNLMTYGSPKFIGYRSFEQQQQVVENNRITMAVVDKGDPDGSISLENWSIVEARLSKLFLSIWQEYPGSIPSIKNGGWFQYHVKLVSFADLRSLDLYKIGISRVGELWPGAKLEVVKMEDVPNRPRTSAWIPAEPSNPQAILDIIHACNPALNALNWKVTRVDQPKWNYRPVTFVIDSECLFPLFLVGGVINYGFTSITMTILKKCSNVSAMMNMSNVPLKTETSAIPTPKLDNKEVHAKIENAEMSTTAIKLEDALDAPSAKSEGSNKSLNNETVETSSTANKLVEGGSKIGSASTESETEFAEIQTLIDDALKTWSIEDEDSQLTENIEEPSATSDESDNSVKKDTATSIAAIKLVENDSEPKHCTPSMITTNKIVSASTESDTEFAEIQTLIDDALKTWSLEDEDSHIESGSEVPVEVKTTETSTETITLVGDVSESQFASNVNEVPEESKTSQKSNAEFKIEDDSDPSATSDGNDNSENKETVQTSIAPIKHDEDGSEPKQGTTKESASDNVELVELIEDALKTMSIEDEASHISYTGSDSEFPELQTLIDDALKTCSINDEDSQLVSDVELPVQVKTTETSTASIMLVEDEVPEKMISEISNAELKIEDVSDPSATSDGNDNSENKETAQKSIAPIKHDEDGSEPKQGTTTESSSENAELVTLIEDALKTWSIEDEASHNTGSDSQNAELEMLIKDALKTTSIKDEDSHLLSDSEEPEKIETPETSTTSDIPVGVVLDSHFASDVNDKKIKTSDISIVDVSDPSATSNESDNPVKMDTATSIVAIILVEDCSEPKQANMIDSTSTGSDSENEELEPLIEDALKRCSIGDEDSHLSSDSEMNEYDIIMMDQGNIENSEDDWVFPTVDGEN